MKKDMTNVPVLSDVKRRHMTTIPFKHRTETTILIVLDVKLKDKITMLVLPEAKRIYICKVDRVIVHTSKIRPPIS